MSSVVCCVKNGNRTSLSSRLFNEVQRAVESKQLQPTLRTVYMRTAFQVPFDASVRCSLDTSLAMLCENPAGGGRPMFQRWYRDPELPLHRTEMTRFPHAVLEVKLALGPGEEPPTWVRELAGTCSTRAFIRP